MLRKKTIKKNIHKENKHQKLIPEKISFFYWFFKVHCTVLIEAEGQYCGLCMLWNYLRKVNICSETADENSVSKKGLNFHL
ncbi:hypothetical protein BIV59_16240 [Bacillus sp. MUM 13]|nr:hypothetical protein BIV59_16240 [Bacillus sp. MUM 13]